MKGLSKWLTKAWWFEYQTRIKVMRTTTVDVTTGRMRLKTTYTPQYRKVIWDTKWEDLHWGYTQG